MRLTLRTMLAFLDDVLEPADAEQLGKKIQDSEFASGLVHRIRSTMRKLRLGAPKLEGKGMGLDPNTVAEYLDSTLSADRVPDFEKVCLESDVHLAEVASCHQILTLVLGEPADVPPTVRQRIYRIASLTAAEAPGGQEADAARDSRQADDSAEPVAAGTTAAVPGQQPASDKAAPQPSETEPEGRASAKPEIPDYLKAGSRRSILPYLATGLLVFLIASVALLAVGPESIIALFQGEPAATPTAGRGTSGNDHDQGFAAAPLEQSARGTSSGEAGEAAPAGSRAATGGPATASAGAAAAPPKAGDKGTGEEGSAPAQRSEAEEPPEPAEIPGVTPAAIPPAAEESAAGSSPPDGPLADGPVGAPGTKPADAAKGDVGRYISEKQVLARFDPEKGDWYRLASGAPLRAGDRLLVLPTYRPQLALASGVQLTFAGASRVQLQPLDDQGAPQLSVQYGRILLMTIGRAGVQLGLDLGGRRAVATFADADAAMAVEVSRYLPLGSNPETDPAQTVVQITTTRGTILWTAGGKTTEIAEGNAQLMIDDGAGRTVALEEFAPWISSTGPGGIDQIASQTLESLVDESRPLVVSLEERVADNRVEVRMLASRCLSYLDRHESFVRMLRDGENRSFWEASFQTAQRALARSPEAAAAVRAAFAKLRGSDAGQLYRLLWGYSPQQLQDPDTVRQLVGYLNHPSMDYRVLAFMNLKRITGLTLLYRPEVSDSRRAISVRRWREKAEGGQIVYKRPPPPPVPIPAVEPAAEVGPGPGPAAAPGLAPADQRPVPAADAP